MRLDCRNVCLFVALSAVLFVGAAIRFPATSFTQEQVKAAAQTDFEAPIRTDSPRATVETFLRLSEALEDETIGVRYETSPDQLRFLLAQIRRMFYAHPRIDPDTVRVRFSGYGPSALNINIRVYASTREWNDFFAIRGDVLLRVFDIVGEAGTAFAFNSQTLYLARDQGLDWERGEAAREAVEQWRRTGRLPFPKLSREEIERLHGKLDYPPRGSTEASGGEPVEHASAEPLSVSSSRTDWAATAPPDGDDLGRRS